MHLDTSSKARSRGIVGSCTASGIPCHMLFYYLESVSRNPQLDITVFIKDCISYYFKNKGGWKIVYITDQTPLKNKILMYSYNCRIIGDYSALIEYIKQDIYNLFPAFCT